MATAAAAAPTREDFAFLQIALAERLIEHCGKIFARGRGSSSGSH